MSLSRPDANGRLRLCPGWFWDLLGDVDRIASSFMDRVQHCAIVLQWRLHHDAVAGTQNETSPWGTVLQIE